MPLSEMKAQAASRGARGRASTGSHLFPARKQQLSVKITEDACERFRRLAHDHGLTLGELFEQALDAWVRQRGQGGDSHAAVARGTDVDKPRNLAKIVTVE